MDKEILSIILLLVFLLLVGLLIFLNNSKKIDSTIRKRIYSDLLQIKVLIKKGNSLLNRDAIIRLDSLLAKSLQLYYKNSESCGTNLKNAKTLFNKKEYNQIWEIHKLRNKVVHENQEVSTSQLTDGYNIIAKAIQKLLYG